MVAVSNQDERDASTKDEVDEVSELVEAMAGMPMGRTLVVAPTPSVEVSSSTDSAAKEEIHDCGVGLGLPYGLPQGPAPSPYSRQPVGEAASVVLDVDSES